jgi:Peptidase family S41/N-terminal domain of Peptidase_S41 in eukaryotic IRBP
MSEKIYAWLLRFYPSHFRKGYGDEALQLLRDRKRDEKGLLPGLRLWLDLLADLAVSLPSEYRRVPPQLPRAVAALGLDGLPSFHSLKHERPSLGALLLGSLLSLSAFAAFPAMIRQLGNSRPQGVSGLPGLPAQPPTPSHVTTSWLGAAHENVRLDTRKRHRIIEAAIANLKEHYVYPDVAQKTAEALETHERNGDDDAATDGRAFAGLLTRQIRDVSHDMHLEVVYSRTPLPDRPTGPSPERLARYRKAMEDNNCTFEKVQVLPHNIGYLKLNSFPDPSVCGSTAKSAMASLNDVRAIIFDLRDNHGGYPGMVMLIAAYLFDHPEYMYNPREDTTEQSWTRSPVPGNKLAARPVYVLTSAGTFSGAEHFSYDLKMLKRATLVGETTAGATDVGAFHRIDDHFGMGIRETKPINPYSEPDWVVVGVQPDVNVKAEDALKTAERLAEDRVKSR